MSSKTRLIVYSILFKEIKTSAVTKINFRPTMDMIRIYKKQMLAIILQANSHL